MKREKGTVSQGGNRLMQCYVGRINCVDSQEKNSQLAKQTEYVQTKGHCRLELKNIVDMNKEGYYVN